MCIIKQKRETEEKGRKPEERERLMKKKQNETDVYSSRASFSNSPPSLKTFPLIFWHCHSFLASPQGSIKIVQGKECDALVWSARRLAC